MEFKGTARLGLKCFWLSDEEGDGVYLGETGKGGIVIAGAVVEEAGRAVFFLVSEGVTGLKIADFLVKAFGTEGEVVQFLTDVARCVGEN